ncbi:MAG TPA: fasciclin domain-containing protein [Flavobacterium sp.]
MTFSTISCDEDDDQNPTETITSIFLGTENISIFAQAVIRADLATIFDDENVNLTVFAPTDEAFAAYLTAEGYDEGIYDVDLDPEVLRQFYLKHKIRHFQQNQFPLSFQRFLFLKKK